MRESANPDKANGGFNGEERRIEMTAALFLDMAQSTE